MIAALLLSAALAQSGHTTGHPTTELLGRWHGTSVCTKSDWNAACHDEEALYEVAPGSAPDHVVLHGYKIVDGKPLFMGDLDFAYDPALKAWTSEFQNARVHVRWIFEVSGDEIRGRAVSLPSLRIARDIHVRRQPGG